EIEEVETPGTRLQVLVRLDHRPEIVAQPRSEIRAGAADERVEPALHEVATIAPLLPRGVLGPDPALPPPVVRAAELDQLGLEPVVVARAELLAAGHVLDEARDVVERSCEDVAVARRRWLRTERRQVGEDLVDLAIAVERPPPPRRREVAPLDELVRGA